MRAPHLMSQLILVDAALGLDAVGGLPPCESASWVHSLLRSPRLRTALLSASVSPPETTAFWLRQFVSRKDAVTVERVPAYQTPFTQRHFTAGLGAWAEQFTQASCEDAISLKESALRALKVPVSLVWGRNDTVTPLAQAHGLKARWPGADLTVLDGVGHIPHIEDPEAFHEALIGALKNLQ